ncbi:hypothetical protein WR25_00059 [Diploscapter pachys]|uniref:Uncharacterized protein n=1 Tax=Diploscapter pachys TaxID=2018661 RepID=A0A2A2KEH5_9BILA|nr:hypothetical protein WR25_00059 [Diploscapter pachys]
MRFSLILLLAFVLCIVFIEGKKVEGSNAKGKKDVKAHGKHDKGNGKGHTVADAKKDKKKTKQHPLSRFTLYRIMLKPFTRMNMPINMQRSMTNIMVMHMPMPMHMHMDMQMQFMMYVNQLREELNAAEEALAAEDQSQQQQKTKPPTRSSEL